MITQYQTQHLGKTKGRIEVYPPPNTLYANFRRGSLPSGCSFIRASNAGFFTATGQWATALTNTPRFDHDPATGTCRGLLIEETRTNYLRNNTMQGAVAGTLGSGGSLPTHWSLTGQGTLTAQVATGSENGMEYLDLTLTGTTSTTSLSLVLEDTSSATASSGQRWVASGWLRLVSGSAAGITTSLNLISNVQTESSTTATLGSTLQRHSAYATLSSGSTHAWSALGLAFESGQTLNITIRLALPQLEKGRYASSMVKTSGVTATRMPDIPSWSTLGAWWNSQNGTLLVDAITQDNGNNGNLINVGDGTTANRYTIGGQSGTGQVVMAVVTSSNLELATDLLAWQQAGRQRCAASWSSSGGLATLVMAANGTTLENATSITLPTVNKMELGRVSGYTSHFNGWVQGVMVMPHTIPAGELLALTQI